jgi:hypothetical protein
MQGEDYDATHWSPGIYFGRNTGAVQGVSPVYLDESRFALPFFCRALPENAEETGHRWRNACLIGTWREDDSGIDWDLTSPISIDTKLSNDDSEPCVARLPDGRLLMTLRARKYEGDSTTVPSGRFHAVSTDAGRTWTDPAPMYYTDGGQVYCPACLAHVFLSSKNGRLYMITNYLDEPTVGCDPRTTLQIAEVDIDSLHVIRDTMTAIETRDAAAGQPKTIRFSNWRWYEDRETKNIVLHMTACPGNDGRHEDCGCPPHSYRYEIALPD